MIEHQTESRSGPGFDPHSGGTVLCPCARHINSPEYWLIPRKWWLHSDMTGMLNLNTNNSE